MSVTIHITAPFNPNPNGGNSGVGGNVEDPEETDGATVGIILGIIFGVTFIIIIFVFFTSCEGCKLIKGCFKGCFESIRECLACCFGGCLSFLKIFDIRQYFGNEDNGYVCILMLYILYNYSTYIVYIRS